MTNGNIQSLSTQISNWYDHLPGFKKIAYFSLLIPLILSLVISSLSFFVGIQYTDFKEEKNIAQGFLIDINSVEPRLENYINGWDAYLKDPLNITRPGTPIDPFYSESGAYHVYGKDMYRLDPELSGLLRDFYSYLDNADINRRDFYSAYATKDYYFLPEFEKTNYNRYQFRMENNARNALQLIPKIKELLDEKQNSRFYFIIP